MSSLIPLTKRMNLTTRREMVRWSQDLKIREKLKVNLVNLALNFSVYIGPTSAMYASGMCEGLLGSVQPIPDIYEGI